MGALTTAIIAGVGVAAGVGFGAAQTIQAESARKSANRAARRQQDAQEALLDEQASESERIERERQNAAKRDATIMRRRLTAATVGRAGQGAAALLGSPSPAGAGVSQSGGKTLLGL